MSVITTVNGMKLDLLAPRESSIISGDIAHALNMIPRFNGHTEQRYSVLKHSLVVAHFAPHHLKLHALLHDASEAYICDIPSPLKALMKDYKRIERRIQNCIYSAYNVETDCASRKWVKDIDLRVYWCEEIVLRLNNLDVPVSDNMLAYVANMAEVDDSVAHMRFCEELMEYSIRNEDELIFKAVSGSDWTSA